MKKLPWLRLWSDTVDDERLRLLAFEDRWHYMALNCLKALGLLDAGDPIALLQRKVAVKLGLQLRELEGVATRLGEVGLIDPETFQPLDWDERQFVSDSDPTAAERKRRQRERQRLTKQIFTGVTDASRVTVTDVTRTDTDTDTDSETTTTPGALTWDSLPQLSAEQRAVVVGKLKKLDPAQRQDVLDELAGAFRAKTIKKPWPVWLRGVIQNAIDGEFQPSLALTVKSDRKRRIEAEELAAKRQAEAAERSARFSTPESKAKNAAGWKSVNEALGS